MCVCHANAHRLRPLTDDEKPSPRRPSNPNILRAILQFIYDRGGEREMIEFIDACEADMMKTMGLSSQKDEPDDEP